MEIQQATTAPAAGGQAPALPTGKPAGGSISVQQAAERMAVRREQIAQNGATTAGDPAQAAAPPQPETANPGDGEPQEADRVETGDAPQPEEPGEEQVEEQDEGDAEEEAKPAVDGDDDGETLVELRDGTQVKLSELVDGYMKAGDYTRKTQALAEERKALATERQQAQDKAKEHETGLQTRLAELDKARSDTAAERKRYADMLEVVGKALNSEDEQWSKVDWDELEAKDPVKAATLYRRYQQQQETKRQLEAEKQDIARKERAQIEAMIAEKRQALHAHVAANHPDLRDPAKGNELWAAMLATAKTTGYSDEEIAVALDPRGFDLWKKATLYDLNVARQAAASASPDAPKPDPTTGKLRVIKSSGASRPKPIPAASAALGRATAAHNRGGSIESFVAKQQAKRAAGKTAL